MHKTILGLAIVGLCISGGQAQACDGSNIIFEDKFEDDAGGWSIKETIEVRDGAFVFKLPPDDLQSNLNVTFTVKDADICAEAVWPESGDQPMLGAALTKCSVNGLNEKAIEIAETWHQEGNPKSIAGLLETQSVWLNFDLARARAIADYQQNLTKLEQLVGGSLEDGKGQRVP